MAEELIFNRLDATHVQGLTALFKALQDNGDERFFHPHPLTGTEAAAKARYTGDDLYFVVQWRGKIVGYAMLRGWDEGYSIPSLGLAIHPSVRGRGFGAECIRFLHQQAKKKGAEKVRLTVAHENHRALRLYEKEGYVFNQGGRGQFEGFVTL